MEIGSFGNPIRHWKVCWLTPTDWAFTAMFDATRGYSPESPGASHGVPKRPAGKKSLEMIGFKS